jgi:hypothetical protein
MENNTITEVLVENTVRIMVRTKIRNALRLKLF